MKFDDPTLKQRWVDALRSGKYKQIPGALVTGRITPEGYCCLGVLNEVAEAYQSYDFEKIGVHFEVFEDENFVGAERGALIRMNDEQGKTFEEIADWIETR